MSVELATLPNGLRVVTDSNLKLESAAVGVWVDAGGRHETREVNGVAHLLEHMAFKGTESRSARGIAEEIEAVGGHLNAYTSREHTAYYARVLKADVPLAIDILADILQRSTFAEDELARERAVVVQEIGQAEDTPDDIIFDHLQAAAFPDQPLGWSILGPAEGVAAMSRDALRGFMGRHYRAQNMVVAAAGAVRHDEIVRLAERQFGGLAAAEPRSLDPARWSGGDRREDRDLEQVHFALALPSVPYSDPDFYASQIYSTMLGGGMSSRLFQEVREKRGLCYSIFSFASSFVDGGLFGVYAGTGADEIAELADVVVAELLRAGDDATEEEVARARAQLKAGTLMSLESSSSRVEQLGRQMLIYGRPLGIEEIVARIDGVDAAAVRRIARRIAGAGRPTIAALGPLGQLAQYDEVAAKFG